MIEGKRVVVWTPYGRERTVSLLAEYMKRDHARGIVDEWWLCENTDPEQSSDIVYMYKLALGNSFISRMERPADCPRLFPKQRNTGYFYRYMTDPDTVYVRLDDDIVYVHEDAIERMVRHRLEAQVGVATFPVMWNNAIITYFLQNAGIVPREWGEAKMYCMDPIGWADGQFAVKLHHLLLDALESGDPHEIEKLFLYHDMQLPVGMQFSVSAFASLGSMYAGLDEPGVLMPSEEESWHTIHEPQRIGQPNVVHGNALVAHYTFFPQKGIVEASDVLDRYRALAQKVNG